jgi:hypothetical protein
MSRKKRHPSPPADGQELRRAFIVATAQSFIREALLIVLREIWRGGPW